MMKAVSTSETSANFYQTTRRSVPEEQNLYARRREDLKSRLALFMLVEIVHLTTCK
jgi:hypothetical protein